MRAFLAFKVAFEMRNRQEHGFYIGDDDILNVTEPAVLRLVIAPADAAVVTLADDGTADVDVASLRRDFEKLLTFSRQHKPQLQPLELNRVIARTLESIEEFRILTSSYAAEWPRSSSRWRSSVRPGSPRWCHPACRWASTR